MIRLYQYMAERVLISLAYLQQQRLDNWHRTLRPFAEQLVRITPDRKMAALIEHHLDGAMPPESVPVEVDELIKYLIDRLYVLKGPGARGAEGDLIDTIVRILGLPYARNILAGRQLQDLRKSILLPDERAQASGPATEKEMHCGGCGKLFLHGEMATMIVEGELSAVFLCTNCATPRAVACTYCTKETVYVNEKRIRALFNKGHSCGCREQMLQEQATGAATDATAARLGDAAENLTERVNRVIGELNQRQGPATVRPAPIPAGRFAIRQDGVNAPTADDMPAWIQEFERNGGNDNEPR